MHYVKHFNINGVDTKQVACIELQGVPNAATEGCVGVLGMDMSSPTHEVYRCVAVNGSVYTWELLSAGMSIIGSTITGEGGISQEFPYDTLKIPTNYLLKPGDLILDCEGYLYQVESIGAESCITKYSGTHLGGDGIADKDYSLVVVDGRLRLVTGNGNVVSEIEHLIADETTIYRDPTTGKAYVMAVKTINGTLLRFFVGTQETYNTLTDAQKANLFAIFTDDKAKEEISNRLNTLEQAIFVTPTLNSAKKLTEGAGFYSIYIKTIGRIINMGVIYWLGETTDTVTYTPSFTRVGNGNIVEHISLAIGASGGMTVTQTTITDGTPSETPVTSQWEIYTVKVGDR